MAAALEGEHTGAAHRHGDDQRACDDARHHANFSCQEGRALKLLVPQRGERGRYSTANEPGHEIHRHSNDWVWSRPPRRTHGFGECDEGSNDQQRRNQTQHQPSEHTGLMRDNVVHERRNENSRWQRGQNRQ